MVRKAREQQPRTGVRRLTATNAAGLDVVAAAWRDRSALITLHQVRVLLQAAQWAGMNAREFATLLVKVTGVCDLETLSSEGFDRVMDKFVARGFRHPIVPIVTAAQLACLDEARRQLGLDGRQYVTLIRHIGGVPSRHHLDGVAFLAVWKFFHDQGARVALPKPGFMCRRTMGLLHQAAFSHGMTPDTLAVWRMSLGGVPALRWLDERGFFRLLAVFDHLGVVFPPSPPIAPARSGMVTQAQSNLIWKLWHDIGGWNGDSSEGSLDAAIGSMMGLPGGLETLTKAGARAVIDRMLVPLINDRLARDAAIEAAGQPPRMKIHDDKQRSRRKGRARKDRR